MKTLPLRIMLMFAATLGCQRVNPAPVSANVALTPAPVKLEQKEGFFVLTADTAVVAGPGAVAEAEKLAAWLRAPTGFPLPVTNKTTSENLIELALVPEAGAGASAVMPIAGALEREGLALPWIMSREGYQLSVTTNRVSIRGGSATGLFYGGVTFRQLLTPEIFSPSKVTAISTASAMPVSGEAQRASPAPIAWRAPCVVVEDYPRFKWRGLLLDVARHYMPPEFIRKLVDLIALHKLNSLQLHLTDDQGWRLEIKKYPRLTQVGSLRKESPRQGDRNRGDGIPYGPFFYTQAQIRDLVAYAQTRHVTLVPEIEMPGHFLGALTAHPEFSCRGGPFQVRTRWGIEPDILCPGNEGAIAFVQDILSEVVELFPSPFIHIGGDEAPRDRWKQCPKCQARIKSEGLKNEAQLQTYLNRRLEEFLASKGRRLIGWDEILEGGLTPGAAVMSWRGTEGGIAAAEAGHDVVMSPTSHCYFDYAQAHGPGEPECIGGFIPLQTVYAFEPMPESLPAAKRKHILGAQGNVWTEFIWTPQQAEYFAFPRAVALAEVVWSPVPRRSLQDFLSRLKHHLKRLDQLKVNYRKLAANTNNQASPGRQTGSPPAITPSLAHVNVFVSGQDGYHTFRIPSVIVTAKGVVLAFAEGRKKSTSDTGDIDLVLKRSTNGGQTWGKLELVWDDGPNTCGNPCPVVDCDTGVIWLLLTHNLGADRESQIVDGASQGTRTVWLSRSDDDGVSWSKPVEITKAVKRPDWTWYATGPGVGIQLRGGRLIVPCDNKVAVTKQRQSHIIFSDDHGATWKLGGVVGPNCNESQAVELADGSLVLNMRSYQANNRRLIATSSDGGLTFSAPQEDPALIEPVCQASILRYTPESAGAKNSILFSNPASLKRERMTVRLSHDEGKTWPVARELYAGPSAYSCLVVLPDKSIGCLYERGAKSAYETIVLARLTLEWLTR
jgi:hexosaminidase